MLTLDECMALCGLTEEEILAISHHEHLTEIAAAELGDYLLRMPDGELRIKRIIKDDIEEALASNRRDRAVALKVALRHFICEHPRCDDRRRAALAIPERRTP